ncbi:MAG: site-specific DNA-methyltransferase [Armatimonadota bacterium]
MKMYAASDPETQSADLVAENIEQLKVLFPEAFTEGKVDFDVLKELLSGVVDEHEEKYGLNWHGKRRARRLALTPSTGTLRPCPQDSVDWDTTKHLMIEGDNLEVLKLMQKSYAGKVKLIYIDPPYNTGNDFVYPDDYQDNIKNYLELTRQVDGEGRKLSSNTEASGRFHTDWLNMIYPRIKLAKNLLDDDGMLVAQISDTELPNLRRILDEIFGEENYINTISVKAKVAAGASGGGEDKRLKKNVEYLLVYANSYDALEGFTNCFVEEPLMDVIADMREAGQSWKYTSVLVNEGTRQKVKTVKDGDGNPIDIFLHTGIIRSSIRDICRQENISEEAAYLKYLPTIFSDTNAQSSIRTRVIDATAPLTDGQVYSVEYIPTSGRDKGKKVCHYYISPTVRRVIWLKDVAYADGDKVIKRERTGTLWDDISYNNIGKEGNVQFANGKKPMELIRRVIGLSSLSDMLIVDFFAGSGTTGHAVMAQNSADEGSRRYILIQLPEPLDPNDSAQASACDFCREIGKPLNISELTKERLRRSAKKIKEENQLFAGDLGFRVFKLDSSNIREWDPDRHNLAQSLEEHAANLKTDRTEQDILFELLLKLGLDLTVPIEEKTIAGKNIQSIGAGTLLTCLAAKIAGDEVEALALGIIEWHKALAPAGESQVVFRDSAFTDEIATTTLTAILQQYGLDNVRSL